MSEAGQRHRWDHLVGRNHNEAREEIKRDKPDAVVETVPHVRVWLWCILSSSNNNSLMYII